MQGDAKFRINGHSYSYDTDPTMDVEQIEWSNNNTKQNKQIRALFYLIIWTFYVTERFSIKNVNYKFSAT